MRRALSLLAAIAAPVLLPRPAAAQEGTATEARNVRVTARIVLLDRRESDRVGLRYLQAGDGRIWVGGRHAPGVAVAGDVAGIPVAAFLELARDRGVLRSETRAQVTTLAGTTGRVGSGTLAVGGWGATREQGPELVVRPVPLADGSIRLDVRARLRDEVQGPFGHRADGSPVDAATTVIVRPGAEATIGSVGVTTERTDTGLLRWERAAGARDVLVVLTADVLP